MLTRTLAALALLSACLAAPAWAQSPALVAPTLVVPGKFTYGTAATFAPFEYQVDGQNTGFDIELGAAVAEKMGLAPAATNMDFAGLIPALQGGRVDVINSGMYMNAKRAEQVEFVPYMRIGNEVIVRKGNPLGIAGHDNLCGRRVAVTLGGIEETYAHADSDACQKADKPPLTVLTLPTAQDCALSLRQARVDAMYDSTPGAAELIGQLPDTYQTAGEPFENGTQIGIAVRKGDTAMHDAVEHAVRAVVADGTYARLLTKYHLPASSSIF